MTIYIISDGGVHLLSDMPDALDLRTVCIIQFEMQATQYLMIQNIMHINHNVFCLRYYLVTSLTCLL